MCIFDVLYSITVTRKSYRLDVVAETSKVTFNSIDLTLGRATVRSSKLNPQGSFEGKLTFDKKLEQATLEVPVALPAKSKAQLKLSFEGNLPSNAAGYFKSFWEHDGKQDFCAATHLQVITITDF